MLNSKKIITFLLIILVFFVLPQAILVRSNAFWKFYYFFGTPDRDDAIRLDAQLHLMDAQSPYKKVFILGGSDARENFDINALNETFKDKKIVFYDLAIAMCSPGDLFMMKKELLDKRPDIIIYINSPVQTYYAYNFQKLRRYFNPEIVPLFIKYYGLKDHILIRHFGYFADAFLGEFSIFFKYRESLREVFIDGAKDYLGIKKIPAPQTYAYRNETHDESWFKNQVMNKDYFKKSPSLGMNKYSFITFAKYTLSKGTKLIVIDGPLYPDFYKTTGPEFYLSYLSFLNKSSHELGFTFIPKEQLPKLDREDYADFFHLNASGRAKLTPFLEEYIRKNPSVLSRSAPVPGLS